ncbi:MAG: hypothetical protein PUD02_06595 [Eggerthellales bacterium]|nr:hypothetical protein [Eggerthellales bacterium]
MDVTQAKAMKTRFIDTLIERGSPKRGIKNTEWILGHLLNKCEEVGIGEVNPKTLRIVTLHYMDVDIMDPSLSYGQATIRATVSRFWTFCNTGELLATTVIYPVNIPQRFKEPFMEFCDYVDSRQFASATKRSHKDLAMKALRYFEKKGVEDITGVTVEIVRSFVRDEFTGKGRSKLNDSSKARFFIDWLNVNGHIPCSADEAFPYGFGRRIGGKNIPSHYTPDEVRRTMAAVDRSTPIG